MSSWVVFSRVDVAGRDERVILAFLAGGGFEDNGNKCSGMRGVDASVEGLSKADDGISSIV